MVDKKKKQLIKEESKVDTSAENRAPDKVYNSFDEFFHIYALENKVNLKWKDSVKKHLKAINCLKDPSKWMVGVKHFGL